MSFHVPADLSSPTVPLPCHEHQRRRISTGHPRSTQQRHDLGPSHGRLVAHLLGLPLGAGGRLAEALIGLAVPGRPIGPWPRRTGAPEASATGQDRRDAERKRLGELGHIGATGEW
jgi:hypothetical protein